MHGKKERSNVSVAAGIVLFSIVSVSLAELQMAHVQRGSAEIFTDRPPLWRRWNLFDIQWSGRWR